MIYLVIKIALSGCGSSGKSTLFNDLKKILSINYNVNTIEEVVRPMLESLDLTLEKINGNEDLMFMFEYLLIEKHYKEEIEKSKGCDILLMDRTIYDYYLYAENLLLEEYYNKIPKYHLIYDLIIYCEPLEFKNDGVRYDYRDKGEIKWFEEKTKPMANLILPPIEHYKRLNMIFNEIEKVIK